MKKLLKGMGIGAVLCLAMCSAKPRGASAEDRIKALETEIALAKNRQAYLVLDAGTKTAEIRIRGLVLKKWDLEKIGLWGKPPGVRAVKLVRRTGWSAMDRTVLKAEAGGEETTETKDIGEELLELEDMPGRYGFQLEEGIRISVRPASQGIFLALSNLAGSIGKSIGWPLKTLWFTIKRKPFTNVFVVTKHKNEAKAIFWSCPEGTLVLLKLK